MPQLPFWYITESVASCTLLFAADRILGAREITENVFSREGRMSEERVIQTNRFFRIPWYTFSSQVAIFRKETALTRIVTLKRARFKPAIERP